jgi:hypothetical protein
MANKLHELIETLGLDMVISQVPSNPNMDHDGETTFYHYHAIITHKADSKNPNSMSTYYSVGWGIVERWLFAQKKPLFVDGWGIIQIREAKRINKHLVSYQNMIAAAAKRFKPSLADILTCLIQDAASIDQSPLFEDWADDFGYNPDSRKAYATFEVIQRQRAYLIKVVGHSIYNQMIEIIQSGDWED